MSKVRLTGSNSGYVEIAAAADAGNLTFTMPTTGTALFGNGNNVISGITTFNAALDINSTVDVSGTSVFNNDVTFDGATAGYDVVWDRSDNALEFAANTKATFGNNQDMQLYHDGNHGYVADAGTGNLRLRSGTLEIQNLAGSKTSAVFSSGGGQTLNFNNNAKFVTTNTGAVITGICTATSFSGDGSDLTGLSTPLSFRNKIINGDFTIHQRGGTIASSTGNYTLDRWRTYRSGDSSGGFSVQQSTTSYPQTNISGVIDNFKASAFITVTSAGSAAANNNCKFQQRIEGSNVYDLAFGTAAAKKVTVSFYVKCSLSGNFGVALVNGDHNRSNVKLYTVNNASTWERKVVTFDGDTSGSWNFNTETGLQLMFDMGSGSSKHASSTGTWLSGEFHGTTSSVKLIHTNGATMQYAGVQLEAGDTATPFEHRSFGEEIVRCQRYYATFKTTAHHGRGGSSSSASFDFQTPVPLRTTPTVTNLNVGTMRRYDNTNYGVGSATASAHDLQGNSVRISFFNLSNVTDNYSCWLVLNNMGLDAEL